jgi:hypothetical protein
MRCECCGADSEADQAEIENLKHKIRLLEAQLETIKAMR